ncbi:Bug family tripartite tricarboxylate transporter substrate binding protein [Paraburkholderia gardini]|uniref:Tripartite-type tricarboxylate transporter receptor subunit TctC n=1 Tax=Paraburkholderia gardini TaxID=2823469 RepID=A0ABN7QRM0_9BURK|nr:tripartite tricarboxylate transporter substrate-binding protein [Paraburkholderia gardini]CAG4923776.1 hypothetical protein R54767_05027 [Paraburkholderia gardini]
MTQSMGSHAWRAALFACGLLAMTGARPAHADTDADKYPSHAISIVVPFAAGGAGDLTTRVFAQKLTQLVNEPVVILNRPGAGLVNSATMVAHARPDGYTVFLDGNGAAISSVLFRKLPYSKSDFKQVSSVAFFSLVLLVDGHSPYKTVGDLIAAAKAQPGHLNIGAVSVGSTQNLAANLFRTRAGVDMRVIPFQTSSEVITALRGDLVQAALELIPSALGQVSSGAVRALAVTSVSRFAGLPQVPTLAESGLGGFDATSWSGLSVPAATDDAIVRRLASQSAQALSDPDVKRKMQMLGGEARASTPEEMSQMFDADRAKWQQVIEQANIPRR